MGDRRSGLELGLRGLCAALLGLCLGLGSALTPAAADKVGVAAAVNPDAFSSLAGTPKSQISIGKSIFFNERINTTTSGLVQVLLVDGSTFTVGPGSDLVIDKFVYDPKKQTGQIAASFSKGVMRFVGGKISKNEGGVTVNTPAGALAIRGGIAFADFKGPKNYSILFVFGQYLKMQGQTIFQPGYGFFSNNGQMTTRPFNISDINGILAALTNSNPGGSGQPNGSPDPSTFKLVSTESLSELISDATATQIQNEIDNQLNQPPPSEGQPPPQQTVSLGYAAGMFNQSAYRGEDDQPVGMLNTLSPTDFALLFDGSGKTFQGASSTLFVNGGEPGMGGVKIIYNPVTIPPEIGENLPALPEALFIGAADSQLDPAAITVFQDTIEGPDGPELSQPAQLNSGQAVLFNVPASGLAFCETCDFLKWGAWAAVVNFQDGLESEFTNNVSVAGLWVAGDLPTIGQLPLQGTATYTGMTIGTVAFSTGDSEWNRYAASGNVDMEWDFAQRAGMLQISNFTGPTGPDSQLPVLNMSGRMDTPGELAANAVNRFSGPLLGTLGPETQISGGAVGSFAANGSDKTAGVIGNWGAGNDNYQATGVFGAGRVGPVNPNGSLNLPERPSFNVLSHGPTQ